MSKNENNTNEDQNTNEIDEQDATVESERRARRVGAAIVTGAAAGAVASTKIGTDGKGRRVADPTFEAAAVADAVTSATPSGTAEARSTENGERPVRTAPAAAPADPAEAADSVTPAPASTEAASMTSPVADAPTKTTPASAAPMTTVDAEIEDCVDTVATATDPATTAAVAAGAGHAPTGANADAAPARPAAEPTATGPTATGATTTAAVVAGVADAPVDPLSEAPHAAPVADIPTPTLIDAPTSGDASDPTFAPAASRPTSGVTLSGGESASTDDGSFAVDASGTLRKDADTLHADGEASLTTPINDIKVKGSADVDLEEHTTSLEGSLTQGINTTTGEFNADLDDGTVDGTAKTEFDVGGGFKVSREEGVDLDLADGRLTLTGDGDQIELGDLGKAGFDDGGSIDFSTDGVKGSIEAEGHASLGGVVDATGKFDQEVSVTAEGVAGKIVTGGEVDIAGVKANYEAGSHGSIGVDGISAGRHEKWGAEVGGIDVSLGHSESFSIGKDGLQVEKSVTAGIAGHEAKAAAELDLGPDKVHVGTYVDVDGTKVFDVGVDADDEGFSVATGLGRAGVDEDGNFSATALGVTVTGAEIEQSANHIAGEVESGVTDAAAEAERLAQEALRETQAAAAQAQAEAERVAAEAQKAVEEAARQAQKAAEEAAREAQTAIESAAREAEAVANAAAHEAEAAANAAAREAEAAANAVGGAVDDFLDLF